MEARIAIHAASDVRSGRRANEPSAAHQRAQFQRAVDEAGGRVVPLAEANAMVWLSGHGPMPLLRVLAEHPQLEWVQLPWAGVEDYAAAGAFSGPVTFTCAKGLFGRQVAEHALTMMLSCLRQVVRQARRHQWTSVDPGSLFGRRVTILGAGGIGHTLVTLLRPFECHVRVLRQRNEPLPGAAETLPLKALHAVLTDTEILVLGLPLTAATRRVIGRHELALLPPEAVVINVARGGHIETDALVEALMSGSIAGAGLDVTDPEPLPRGHPLWAQENVLVTSHSADSAEYVTRQLCHRLRRNVELFCRSLPLDGVVDPSLGY
jgi:phosphoglycerate dehydrogenase-like enzyme